MQSVSKKGFLERILFYWTRLYTEELRKKEGYHKLYPAYSLIFTNFNILRETRDFMTSFSVRSDERPYFALNNQLKIVLVELSKFNKEGIEDLFDKRDLWCYILKSSNKIGRRECKLLSAKGEEMRKAVEHLEKLSQDEVLRLEEEAREKFIMDRKAEIAFGFDEGFEKGRQEGKQEGKQEGLNQGKQELIISMIENGMSVELIAKVTGLSAEEINKLQKEY